MIIQITKVTKHTIRDLNMKFGQNQSKNKHVMTAWNVLLKIGNKSGERFSDHTKSKKYCCGVLATYTTFQEVKVYYG